MLERLKFCYVYAYHSNPQLELCKDIYSVLIGILCVVSPVILVQAAFRCFIHKEMMSACSGLSDYEWSIWLILGTKVSTILIGSVGTSFRLVVFVHLMKLDSFGLVWAVKDMNVFLDNPLLVHGMKNDLMAISIEERLINQLKDFANGKKAYEVSSLSLVLLARIATVSDSALGASLSTVLSEIYELIHFIGRKMSSSSFENKQKCVLANAALEGPSSRDELLRLFKISDTEALRLNDDIHQVIVVIGR
ncbi:hypothetical protein Sjap_015267 [Stephania japonica]|uniref:Uncharacterized protein n=1 Tax=Stephania japonica TaxID=461633 RepID=A0AAP0NSQ1_9MAGN